MTKVGFVGWRGMVGSVLMARMQAEGDFGLIEPHFFSTSNAGGAGPEIEGELLHARNIFRVTANRNSHSQQCLYIPARAQGSSNPDDTDPTFRPVDFYRSRADLINESL